jgi:outer membrane protein assembly factor BamD
MPTGVAQPDVRVLRIEDKAEVFDEGVADQQAGTHMDVARYYADRGNYTAALYRLKIVVTQFSKSQHVAEALARQTEAYLALGMASEARTAAAALERRFPGSHWSTRAQDALKSAKVPAK